MKEGLRFVDSDMHVQEPGDLFEKYLDPAFKSRVTSAVGADGKPSRRSWNIDGCCPVPYRWPQPALS